MSQESYTNRPSTQDEMRSGKGTALMLGNYSGLFRGPAGTETSMRFLGVVEDGITLDPLTAETVNEREFTHFGFNQATASDGSKTAEVTLTLEGNERWTTLAVQGINPDVQVAFDPGARSDNFGFLHIISRAISGLLHRSDLLLDVSCKEAPIPGIDAGGNTTQTLKFYGNDYIAGVLQPGYIWQTEGWYDDGAVNNIVNTWVGGVNPTVTLGTGNGSGLTYAANMAKVIDATQALNWKQYIKMIKIQEPGSVPRTLADSEVTSFNVTTGAVVLAGTFDPQAKLMIFWAATTANALHCYDTGNYITLKDFLS